MKKNRLLVAAALLSVALLLAIGVTTSLLTDVESQTNVITIGQVRLDLDEGGFDPTDDNTVVPGAKEAKAPKLTNTGTKDAFVFIKLTVPKANVTLLYEENIGSNLKGTPRSVKQPQELFRFLADDSLSTAAITGSFDEDITYHTGSDTEDGWILLKSDLTGESDNVYYFGYNRKMGPTAETVTLFDEVQLKSFIDGETAGLSSIGVSCFAIQAENLDLSGSVDLTAEHLSDTTLSAILTVVENRTTQTP